MLGSLVQIKVFYSAYRKDRPTSKNENYIGEKSFIVYNTKYYFINHITSYNEKIMHGKLKGKPKICEIAVSKR